MCGVWEGGEVGVREGVEGRDAFTGLVDESTGEEGEGLGAGGGEEVS